VKLNGKEYDVIVQLDRLSRMTPDDLAKIYVRNTSGQLIQLSNVITYQSGAGPNAIEHHNRFRSATIEGTPMGVALGTAVAKTEDILHDTLGSDFRYEWKGDAKSLKDSDRELIFVVVLACIIIYMVLASQFESLTHPITVMFAILLSVVGAFGALWIFKLVNLLGTMLYGWANFAPNAPAAVKFLSPYVPRMSGMTINLFSKVGFVLLLGLATKNSILLVEFANQQMALGKSATEAMLNAGMIRLRPILMTSVATISGILPIAIGFGAGAESRRPLGIVVVGGLITSTILTLLVVPALYSLLSEFTSRKTKHNSKSPKPVLEEKPS
jgi:multidrug efflux pump